MSGSKNVGEAIAPPAHAADPAFEAIGGRFWVRKGDRDVGVRARTRLNELGALLSDETLRTVVAPLLTPISGAAPEESPSSGDVTVAKPVSLRSLDWCVTNYAKRRSVVLFHEPSARWFAIHHEYRAWLKTWRRRLFDPFARRSRIFFHTGSAWVATTVAQLHFIYFVLEFDILTYVQRNLADIERDNNRALRQRANPQKRKRSALSVAPPVSVLILQRPTHLSWD